MQKASAGLSPWVSLLPLQQHSPSQHVQRQCPSAPGADGGATSKTRASPPPTTSFPKGWCFSVSSQGHGQRHINTLIFPGGSHSKESAYNSGDLGLIPGLGRFPGEGTGYPLQSTGRENSMDSPWVAKRRTQLSNFHFQ